MTGNIINQLQIGNVDIRITMVSEIWDWNDAGQYVRCNGRVMGICEPVDGDLTKFNIRIVNGPERDVTVAHELYHVFQYVNGLELNETLAEMFGQMFNPIKH